MGQARTIGALLVATLALSGSVTAAAWAAVPEETVNHALAAEPSRAGAESAEDAAEAPEEAAEVTEEAAEVTEAAADVSAAKQPPRYVVRKIKRLTREIDHVRSVRRRLRTKLVELRHLPSGSTRRERAIPYTREKLRKKRKRLRNLRRERRKLWQSAG
jgi:predicted RNase H-like nuclease (RuvC/YqgF family)